MIYNWNQIFQFFSLVQTNKMKTFLRIICRFLCMSTRYLSRLSWECSFLLPYQMCLCNMLRKYNKYMTEPSERWCQIIKKLLKLLKIGLAVLQNCQCNTEVLKLIFSLAKYILRLNIYTTNIKTTTMSVLMSLFWLAGVGNFCLLLLFLSVIHILSSSQIIPNTSLCTLLMISLVNPFSFFPVSSTSITSHICEMMSPNTTWPCHHRQLWIIISSIFTTTLTLSQRTSIDTLSTSLTPHIILIIWHSTQCNLISPTTVRSHISQQYNKAGLT